jgi:DNA-binding NarL/FixJ family response regulator
LTRVLVIADDRMVARRIRLALRPTAGFELLGFADGRRPIGAVLLSTAPDVVVVDETSDRSQALERLAELVSTLSRATGVLLAAEMDGRSVDEALAAGASTVIARTVEPAALAALLRETANGNIVHQMPAPSQPRDAASVLTARELEVLRYVAMGLTNGGIARELWVTKDTVKFHLSNTYRKLGVANRTQASRYAHVHHLVAGGEPVVRARASRTGTAPFDRGDTERDRSAGYVDAAAPGPGRGTHE